MKNKKIKVGKFLAEGFPNYTLQMMYVYIGMPELHKDPFFSWRNM